MKKHLPRILIFVVLLLVLAILFDIFSLQKQEGADLPGEEEGYLFLHPRYAGKVYQDFDSVLLPICTNPVEEDFRIYPDISVNGNSVSRNAEVTVVKNEIYVASLPLISALIPGLETVKTQDGTIELRAQDFLCRIRVGNPFFQINERYYYIPNEVREGVNGPLLPLDTLAEGFGCTVRQNEWTGRIVLRWVCPPAKTCRYNEEDLYWLSHIIYAESGNQTMAGRVAVGTVVMNRLKNSEFPNSVKEIVLQKGQFSPVDNGTIYLEPDAWSIIAAKMCLTGQREAGESLYFNVSSLHSWAYYNRPYVCTIGGHSFFL